ncbi:MAG: amidophosphoribosyltransferase [Bacteroidetes bacterium MED-G17]|nr:MAG: amidophosphoribosyltransferase [Bacteroidetes bacterium TMED39]PDH52569.1 MAG: amidophosphoribosyltransferase [Bacteroidetes bacterium MED-G17]|tara:strand:+ start:1353 stop:3245 length:1893 start_codon:yes stop_codon:yes gene_type:complete
MSDLIKHECGLVFIRLKKTLSFYQEKYKTPLYGLEKLHVLMTKQLNRGQDGAGIAVLKLNPNHGERYIARKRELGNNAIPKIFERLNQRFRQDSHLWETDKDIESNFPYAGQLLLGHLRYGTHGGNSIEQVHPFLRQNNWRSRNLILAGNFNMTNVSEMYKQLIDLGQHPKEISDNVTMLEKIGHFLDQENQRIFDAEKRKGAKNQDISIQIKNKLDMASILKKSFKNVDGGFVMSGIVGDGNAFVIRDPNGIRPAFYYENDEIFALTSERPALQTALNIPIEEVEELKRGQAVLAQANGEITIRQVLKARENKACSFERIYFSRGNDAAIHHERKHLGLRLTKPILKAIDFDLDNSVFSYVPHSAASAFYGLVDGLYAYLDKYKRSKILSISHEKLNEERLDKLLSLKVRREKILIKDKKMRTFITQDQDRDDLVGNVYDLTYGIVKADKDTLVVVDDSIVRGTTLKKSILKILDRTGAKKIIIASSAPIIKYPDCYGIDMSRLKDFVAFKALISLIEKHKLGNKLNEAYEKAKEQIRPNNTKNQNQLKPLYDLFTDDELVEEIARIVTPTRQKAKVKIIYNSIDSLHKACPNNKGDWYFTGNYPTPGGHKVVNRAFVYYMEGNDKRAY